MSVLDFPTSPTNGQYYNGFIWNSSNETWDSAFAPRAATIPLAGTNVIINGAMDIWQRGTSFTNIANETFHADRWKQNGDGSGATKTWSQGFFTPGDAPTSDVPGTFYLRFAQTVAGTGATYTNPFKQPIENVRTFAGQTVALSFWARADATRTITPNFQQSFGSGGSASVFATGTAVTLTTSWTRYTQTFNIPSIAGKTINSNNFLELYFTVANNTVQTIDLWGVQLESGAAATEFRRNAPSIQAELAACQRYYFNSENVNMDLFIANASDLFRRANPTFPVPLRRTPSPSDMSVTLTGGSTLNIDGLSKTNVRVFTSVGNTTGGAYINSYTVNVEL
jgi:hypothetical protein